MTNTGCGIAWGSYDVSRIAEPRWRVVFRTAYFSAVALPLLAFAVPLNVQQNGPSIQPAAAASELPRNDPVTQNATNRKLAPVPLRLAPSWISDPRLKAKEPKEEGGRVNVALRAKDSDPRGQSRPLPPLATPLRESPEPEATIFPAGPLNPSIATGTEVRVDIEDTQPVAVPTWRQNASLATRGNGGPMAAIVIDDLGPSRASARHAIALPAPLTLAFMPYTEGLAPLLGDARGKGHELLLHIPMEPLSAAIDPGPKALTTDQEPWEIRLRLEWGLDRAPGVVGVNNHMGSRFTADPGAMAKVMQVLGEKGLLYLDSRTTSSSVSERIAAAFDVPFLGRDIFLDHEKPGRTSVLDQLQKVADIARKRGYAIGIGHPHAETLAALEIWLDRLDEENLTLVPLSAIMRHRLAAGKYVAAVPFEGD